MIRLETQNFWQEYCAVLQAEEQGNCASCYGWGNHGYDDENNEMVCYACCGTGMHYPFVRGA